MKLLRSRFQKSPGGGLVAAIVASAVLATGSLEAQEHPFDRAAVDAYVRQFVSELPTPGFAAVVTRGHDVLYMYSTGMTALDDGTAITPRHLFHMASVSKPFVGTAIMRLVQLGRIDLEDRVVDHLPYFRLADEAAQSIGDDPYRRYSRCRGLCLGPSPVR